jgi:Fur family transcriptional regulator, ferric uptake regulator
MKYRVNDCVSDIHASGLKVTAPRIKVLRLFHSGERRHWSAEGVYHALLNEGADIGLATIYRVLLQFVQAGLLTRMHFETGKSVFELNQGEHHDHLVCLRCGRVEEFCDPQIEERQQHIASERGFKLQEHALALYGICAHCDTAREGVRNAQSPSAVEGLGERLSEGF